MQRMHAWTAAFVQQSAGCPPTPYPVHAEARLLPLCVSGSTLCMARGVSAVLLPDGRPAPPDGCMLPSFPVPAAGGMH